MEALNHFLLSIAGLHTDDAPLSSVIHLPRARNREFQDQRQDQRCLWCSASRQRRRSPTGADRDSSSVVPRKRPVDCRELAEPVEDGPARWSFASYPMDCKMQVFSSSQRKSISFSRSADAEMRMPTMSTVSQTGHSPEEDAMTAATPTDLERWITPYVELIEVVRRRHGGRGIVPRVEVGSVAFRGRDHGPRPSHRHAMG
jgi:hypothetical protein